MKQKIKTKEKITGKHKPEKMANKKTRNKKLQNQ